MSTNPTRIERTHDVMWAYAWLISVLFLVLIATACGDDNTSTSESTPEFGTVVESNTQAIDDSSSNDSTEMAKDVLEMVVGGLLLVLWTVLRTLVCVVTTGVLGIVLLLVVFFGSAIYYLKYRDLRYDWPGAIAVGALVSLPVLILRILC